MEDYVIFIVEGRTTKELRQNLDPVLSEVLDYNVSYEIKGNNIIFEKRDTSETLIETALISVFDIGEFLMLVLPIKMMSVAMLFKQNGEILKDRIMASAPFKSLIFVANKERLMGSINALAYNIVQNYKKNFEEKNISFNQDLLPIYIYEVDNDYKVPVAIYEQFHIIYYKSLNVLKEMQ